MKSQIGKQFLNLNEMKNPLTPLNRPRAPSALKTNKMEKVVVGRANGKVTQQCCLSHSRMNLAKPERFLWDPGIGGRTGT